MQDSDEHDPAPTIPYATPQSKDKRYEALAVSVFILGASAVFIVFIGGMSWPTAAVIACLCAVCICLGHFLTRR